MYYTKFLCPECAALILRNGCTKRNIPTCIICNCQVKMVGISNRAYNVLIYALYAEQELEGINATNQ